MEFMNRRDLLKLAGVSALGAVLSPAGAEAAPPLQAGWEWETVTIAQFRLAMDSGGLTAVSLAKAYLERIEKIDHGGPAINSVIELNPDALIIAKAMDEERKAGKSRGPLHGMPVMVKDNLDT